MKFREFVEVHEWTFAKSMPWMPHEYLLRDKAISEELFEKAVKAILTKGVLRRWKKTKVKFYLDAGEWRYWVMEETPEDTKLINRQKIAINTAVEV